MHGLIDAPRQDLTEDEVRETLLYKRGTTTRAGVDILDNNDVPITNSALILDSENGGQISWAYRVPDRVTGVAGDLAAIRRTGTINLLGSIDMNLHATRFRPWIEIRTGLGNWARFWLGVFVPTLPPIVDDGVTIKRSISLADKTYRYSTTYLDDIVVVEEQTDVLAYIKTDLGTRFNETKFSIPSEQVLLAEDQIFEPGISYLEFYNTLLKDIGYDALTMTAAGRPTTKALADVEHSHSDTPGPMVTAGELSPLLPTIPNKIRFVAKQGPSLPEEGNGILTLKNEFTGPASIHARGGEEVFIIVEVDAQMGPGDDPNKFLREVAHDDAQRYFAGGGLRFKGRLGLNPLFWDREMIKLEKPRLGIELSDWHVTSYTINLTSARTEQGALMDFEAEKRVFVDAIG